jgi:hypothetical protein
MRYLKASALASLILIGSACGLGATPVAASDLQTAHARANATLYAMAKPGWSCSASTWRRGPSRS